MAKIDSLKNKQGEVIYPRTLVNAVYDEKGEPLGEIIKNQAKARLLEEQNRLKAHYYKAPVQVCGIFDESEGWANWFNSPPGTFHFVTAPEDVKHGTRSLKFNANVEGMTYIIREGISWDFTNVTYLDMWVKFTQDVFTTLNSFRILMYTGADTSNMFSTNTEIPKYLHGNHVSQDGWVHMTIPRSSWVVHDGTPDYSNVTKMVLEFNAKEGSNFEIKIDQILAMSSPSPRGKITFRWDDAHLNMFKNGKPILDKYNMRGIVGVVGSWVGTESYMSLAGLHNLRDSGWDICNHSWEHKDLSLLPVEEAINEFTKVSNFLIDNNLSDGKFMIIPGHSSSPALQEELKSISLLTSCGTTGHECLNIPDAQCLRYIAMDNTDINTLKAVVDKAEENKDWVIFLGHEVKTEGGTYAITPAVLDALCAYIATKELDVITYSDVVNGVV